MGESKTNMSFHDSNSFELPEETPNAQNPTQLPYLPYQTATLPSSSIVPSHVSYGSHDQLYNPSDGFALLSAPHTNSTLANQTTLSLEDTFRQDFCQGFTTAESQHSEAQSDGNIQLFELLPSSSNAWLTFAMSNTLTDDIQVQLQSLTEGSSLLKCTFPGCADQQTFPTESALKKHQDKHSRPYTCKHASCKGKSYGDKGGLQRHEREAHGSEAFKCPIRTCPRNKKGFARKYNLLEHQKRRHELRSSGIPQTSSRLSHETTEDEESPQWPLDEDKTEDWDGSQHGSKELMVNDERRLRKKLHDLRALRGEIDGAIASLERALDIMGGNSPCI